MKITVKLYANLSDFLPAEAKQNAVMFDVHEMTTVNQVIDHFRVPREQAHLVLINGSYVEHEARDQPQRLNSGDTLAIWPPVAGG